MWELREGINIVYNKYKILKIDSIYKWWTFIYNNYVIYYDTCGKSLYTIQLHTYIIYK